MPQEDLSKLKIDQSVKKSVTGGRIKKPFVIAGLVFLLIIGAVLYRLGVISPTATVDVTTVSLVYPAQSLSVLNASGYIVAQRKAAVASKITGRLTALLVEEGNLVKKGQILARMENADVTAGKGQAAANLANAKAMLRQAAVEQDNLQQEHDRYRRLIAGGYVTQSEYDAIHTRYLRSQEAVKGARAAMEAAAAALSGAEASIDYTLIRAPFDGVVLTKNADVGDIVTPLGASSTSKAAVVTLADMDSLQVEVDVSETSITLIKVGQPCNIQLDALADLRFRGVVHAIVPTVDRAKATVLVKVRFLDKDIRMLPDMSAKVSFLSRKLAEEEIKPRLAVNQSALVRVKEKNIVYLIQENKVRMTAVSTGGKLGDMQEITAGLKPGDRVVLKPEGLTDGAKIKVAER
ncbi:MAG: efflux RND transporter periplasmic adaptor subunit [Deltaproteobacteria bacterium HGW-Deltaproteobacteria-6]|nr:MAG: efflux RND transporter periplasmic adaptor subunit [Deltaproteobacteria bacterium HGW-Deltaproteobacteria-6]